MKKVTLYARDFKNVMDGSGDSHFDGVLAQLGIRDNGEEPIEEITLTVEDFEIE
jgi:hypothetical protein